MSYRPSYAMLMTALCFGYVWGFYIAPLLVAANPNVYMRGPLGSMLCGWLGGLGIGLLLGNFWDRRG